MKIIKYVTCPECGQLINTPDPLDISVRSMDVFKDTVHITFKLPHVCGETIKYIEDKDGGFFGL